jgi:prenylcysteine oxidase/farnesylcysteine lyase
LVAGLIARLNLTTRRPLHAGRAGVFRHAAARHPTTHAAGEFVFTESGWSVVTLAKVLWRYGSSPLTTRSLVRRFVDLFGQLYASLPQAPATSAFGILQAGGLDHLPGTSANATLRAAGVGARFVEELATGITRTNYGSDTTLNGLAGLVSLAGSGADLFAVAEGNQRVAEGAARLAGARVRLSTTVTAVTRVEAARGHAVTYTVGHRPTDPATGCAMGRRWADAAAAAAAGPCPHHARPTVDNAAGDQEDTFDLVVLATPYALADIAWHGGLNATVPAAVNTSRAQHDYRTTHATFVRGRLIPEYFGVATAADIPDTVITMEPGRDTTAPPRIPTDRTVHFSSIGTLRHYPDGTRLIKVFSRVALTPLHLEQFIEWSTPAKKAQALDGVVRRAWYAYPYLRPPASANPQDLDVPFVLDVGGGGAHPTVAGVVYLNAMEAYVSTIETQMLAACNVAHLIGQSLSPRSTSENACMRFAAAAPPASSAADDL